MNEPDLNHLARFACPRLPVQLLLALLSTLGALLLASSALAFTDQNADAQTQARDHGERQRAQRAASSSNAAASATRVARAESRPATRRGKDHTREAAQ